MKLKGAPEYIPWLIAGMAFLTVLLVFAWYAHEGGNTTQRLASKATRIDLVERMQADLAAASEAEKSAVLATTDAESLAFANQARAATAEVVREQGELGTLLVTGGTQRERDLLAQFSTAFGDLQRVDEKVLALEVKNTNIKAYSLLFGPAAEALAAMDDALDRAVTRYRDTTDGKQLIEQAFAARLGLLRIHALLAPHIAEENDAKMDQMEASMTKEEKQVRKALEDLGKLPRLAGDADVVAATLRLDQHDQIKAKILPLSRENSNVRSLALSINQKRKAMILCQDALGALRQAELDEPIAGVTYGRGAKPR